MTLSERIASEIMDTIERERRINRDDLVKAVDRVLQEDRWQAVADMFAPADEKAIIKVLPSYFRPKPPMRFGTWK